MTAKLKIRLDSIEKAHQALEALPQHEPTEVTKTQAIQKLIGPIRASQSKGYSLAAIGRVLSECGIPIATGALRAYLSEGSAGAVGKKKNKSKRVPKAPKATQSPGTTSNQQGAVAQGGGSSARPAVAGTAPAVDLDWEAGARSEQAATPGARRSGFVVRPDTRDI